MPTFASVSVIVTSPRGAGRRLFTMGTCFRGGEFALPVTSKRSAIPPMLRPVLRAILTGIPGFCFAPRPAAATEHADLPRIGTAA